MSNRKYPMLLGILGLIVATMLFLFVTQYYQFLIARALQGLADANCWTLGMTLVADAYPVEQLGAKVSGITRRILIIKLKS
jgi:MFS family permease